VPAVFVALEICGSGLAAEIAIDALIVHVEFSVRVLAVFICWVCHLNELLKTENWGSAARLQSFF
jgi:hypothetical protein